MSRRVVLSMVSCLSLAFGTTVLAAEQTAPAAKHPAAQVHKPQPAFNDPAEAGPDFLLQGEYAGALTQPGAAADYGVQIVARGHGKFHSMGFHGGLPGRAGIVVSGARPTARSKTVL